MILGNIKNLHVYVVYVVFPVVMIFSRAVSPDFISRVWLDIFFVFLFLLSLLVVLIKGKAVRIFHEGKALHLFVSCILFLVIFIKFVTSGVMYGSGLSIIPALMEFKPVFYILASLVGIMAFGYPSFKAYVSSGLILSVLILVSVLLESLSVGHLVRSHGSGEINYDGFLILMSFILSVYSRNIDCRKSVQILLFLGLLLTMSRTVLAVSVLCFFLVGRHSLYKKICIMLAAVFVIYLSFVLRDLPINNFQSMDRYWMWHSAVVYVWGDPSVLIFGFPPGLPHNIDIPPNLQWLWNNQSEGWGVIGIYSFHFHAMWLRVLITWGVMGVFVVLIFVVHGFFYSKNNVIKALMIAVSVSSLTMGVFYVSTISIPLILLLLAEKRKETANQAITKII